jgi:glucose-6-phosphate isomerase
MGKTEKTFSVSLPGYQKGIAGAEAQLRAQRIVARIWEKDYRVWNVDPAEIANRLGWLDSPAFSLSVADELINFAQTVREAGYTGVLLLGMGGSSLAAEVFSRSFASRTGSPGLEVLDSTHPEAVLEYAGRLDPEKTLYVVATKSGGTVETFSFMKFFYNQVLDLVGKEKAGDHFIAITDPGSGLESAARQLNFRKIFLNDANIGGRYAALSLFGMVPAALLGIDIRELLGRAARMADSCRSADRPVHGANTAASLGVIMGHLANSGRDKITLITSAALADFANWLEQLIAESTGKAGKGILPVVGEELMPPAAYGADRFFVYLRLQDDHAQDKAVQDLRTAGQPVVEIVCQDVYDLGGEFFRWEMATAIAGWRMGIQPFDQPNVERAKGLAREMLAEYASQGKLPQPPVKLAAAGMNIYADKDGSDPESLWRGYVGNDGREFHDKGNGYISLQAYIKPDAAARRSLQDLRTAMQKKYKTAVTVGFGPRFLHSTGQLHKGDAGKGLFVQILSRIDRDAPIPDRAGADESGMSFGTLITAQAFGDRKALQTSGRQVVTFQLSTDQETGCAALSAVLANQ